MEIVPASALLTKVGETRTLSARAFDAAHQPAAGQVLWSSSRPETVTVGPDGTLTAKALGSAQVTASVNGVSSVPALVIVAEPAAGVVLVDDARVDAIDAIGGRSYGVTLNGPSPKVGELLLGTGEKPIGGRVTAVEGARLTLALVPLAELLPRLEITEKIDLANAPIRVPADVARLYDVGRDGSTITFAPKANFNELVRTAADLPRVRFAVAAIGAPGNPPVRLAAATGTTALPGLGECEFAGTPSGITSPLSLSGTTPPHFSLEFSPTLDLDITDGVVHRAVLGGAATAKLGASLKVSAVFEGKFACTLKLAELAYPIVGPIAAILALKAGAEMAGKVTITSMELGADVVATSTLQLGVDCPAATGCTLVHEMTTPALDWKPKVDGPSLDLRFQPSFELSVSVALNIGLPLLESAQATLAKVKLGGKIEADWAPKVLQIADAEYASNYKLSVEGGISAGLQFEEGSLLAMLGIGDLPLAEYKITKDVSQSPTGKVTFDRDSYLAGETGTAHVVLDVDHVTFLRLYQVDRVLVVGRTPGDTVVLGSSAGAADGQTEFDIAFTASATFSARDLFGFVVTTIPRLDAFALELALGCDQAMSDGWVRYLLEKTFFGTLTTPSGGSTSEKIYFDPPPDGEGIALYVRDGSVPISVSGQTFAGGSWSGTFSIACDASGRHGKLDAVSTTLGHFEGVTQATLPATPPTGD